MLQEFIIKTFGIRTYEEEYVKLEAKNIGLIKSNNELMRQLEIEKQIKIDLNETIRSLQERLADPEKHWKKVFDRLIEEHDQEYKDIEAWFRHETAKQMEKVNELTEFTRVLETGRDELWNRAYAQGRMDAYSDMGVKVIEIRNEGTTVAERAEAKEKGIEIPQKEIVIKVDEEKRPVEISESIDAELEKIIEEIEIDDLVDVM